MAFLNGKIPVLLFQFRNQVWIKFVVILNQEVHHRKVSFAEEYETFLKFYQKTIILK